MIDTDLREQLIEVFKVLERDVELVVEISQHSDQGELLDLLEDVASVNKHIVLKKVPPTPGMTPAYPKFHIYSEGLPTGVSFGGIPGGHEFSSLILAILNADGKGKMPDDSLVKRIQKLQGPIHLRTVISLSCENCPDVVQALNQMALLHSQFNHEMIDGTYIQEEVQKRGIQGVPSILSEEKLLHSGRIHFLDLLILLEKEFGVKSEESSTEDSSLGEFDVVVVGGGPAGAAAAIYTARKGMKTALIAEKVGGQVQETKGIENLISVKYTEGPQLAAQLGEHMAQYPIHRFEHRRVRAMESRDDQWYMSLESGEKISAGSVIVATGAKWRELGIPGEKEYIGRGVAFCPHCDGPYYKGKKVAVVGGGNSGVEAAIDLAGIVAKVVLIEYNDQLKADHILVKKLQSLNNVEIITSAKTTAIVGDGKIVQSIEYLQRQGSTTHSIPLDGVFVQIGLIPNSQFLRGVVDMNSFGEIPVDAKGRTSAKGIYAAGDVTTTPYKQIIIAMGEGAKAALACFEDKTMR